MKWLGIFLVVGAVLISTAPADAALIASSVDRGEYPRASVGEYLIEPQRAPRIEVRAAPTYPLIEVEVDVLCDKGSASRAVNYSLRRRRAPFSRRIALTFRRAEYCIVEADAQYEGYEENHGRISVKLYD